MIVPFDWGEQAPALLVGGKRRRAHRHQEIDDKNEQVPEKTTENRLKHSYLTISLCAHPPH